MRFLGFTGRDALRLARRIAGATPAGLEGAVIKLGEPVVTIVDLHRQGLSNSGHRPATWCRPKCSQVSQALYLQKVGNLFARTTDDPPRARGRRLWRELKERGFAGGTSVVRDRVQEPRPSRQAGFRVRFETPAGEQAQESAPCAAKAYRSKEQSVSPAARHACGVSLASD
jgi:hypothetical protein